MEVNIVTSFGTWKDRKFEVNPFTEDNVELIPITAKFGNYRIGILKGDDFWVQYFGRSDHNDEGLRKRVSDHLSKGNPTNHELRLYDETYYFWFQEQPNPLEAFKQECRDWHTFQDIDDGKFIDNDIHPARLEGKKCPICNK